MKFGLLYEMQRPHIDYEVDYSSLIDETIEQCRLADEVGFDHLWFVEHHFLTTFSGSSAPEVVISALSRLTKKIRIGFGVSYFLIIIPYRFQRESLWSIIFPVAGLNLESAVVAHMSN
ncbi:MAG: hypothetical protein CM1200mP3_11980 [Chloroflexota bacterium]|nr:MAG: hypothetical protein CM1200mP3_11980 [Chloroflexota bacterium]